MSKPPQICRNLELSTGRCRWQQAIQQRISEIQARGEIPPNRLFYALNQVPLLSEPGTTRNGQEITLCQLRGTDGNHPDTKEDAEDMRNCNEFVAGKYFTERYR